MSDSLDTRWQHVERHSKFRETIDAIREETRLEYEALPVLLNYVSNEPRAVINPQLHVFLYDPEHSDGFSVPIQTLRDIEGRILETVRDDLVHTDASRESLAEYHRQYGRGLGIPRCERRWFSDCYKDVINTGLDRLQSMDPVKRDSNVVASELIAESPEHRAAKASMDRFVWDVLIHHAVAPQEAELSDLLGELPNTFFSRPTTGFYPHSPDCSRAINIGKNVEASIDDEDIQKIYRFELVYNNLKSLIIEYERYTNGFDLETGSYFESIAERFDSSNVIRESLDEMAAVNDGHRLFDYLLQRGW